VNNCISMTSNLIAPLSPKQYISRLSNCPKLQNPVAASRSHAAIGHLPLGIHHLIKTSRRQDVIHPPNTVHIRLLIPQLPLRPPSPCLPPLLRHPGRLSTRRARNSCPAIAAQGTVTVRTATSGRNRCLAMRPSRPWLRIISTMFHPR
jgi:hypothetical protein